MGIQMHCILAVGTGALLHRLSNFSLKWRRPPPWCDFFPLPSRSLHIAPKPGKLGVESWRTCLVTCSTTASTLCLVQNSIRSDIFVDSVTQIHWSIVRVDSEKDGWEFCSTTVVGGALVGGLDTGLNCPFLLTSESMEGWSCYWGAFCMEILRTWATSQDWTGWGQLYFTYWACHIWQWVVEMMKAWCMGWSVGILVQMNDLDGQNIWSRVVTGRRGPTRVAKITWNT